MATPKHQSTHPAESSVVSFLSGWAQQGVQTFFATQRIILDLAMRQNANVMHIVRQQLSDPIILPAPSSAKWPAKASTTFSKARKRFSISASNRTKF